MGDGMCFSCEDSCVSCMNAKKRLEEDLAAMQARAEKAEREAARLLDEQRRPTCNDCGVVLGDNWCADCAGKVHRDRIAALEARLAEQAPVVEAAERYCALLDDHATGTAAALDRLEGAVTVMRAARSLRGAKEEAQT